MKKKKKKTHFKIFIWKAFNYILSCFVNLITRRVKCEMYYKRCSEAKEIIGHALWDCPSAQDYWACVVVAHLLANLMFDSFEDV